MKKEILVAVISSLMTAAILWVLGYFKKLPNEILIPKDAIVAFNLYECPSDGWDVYKPAEGYFLRGINTALTADDDEFRDPGSRQDYATASPNKGLVLEKNAPHSHRVVTETNAGRRDGNIRNTMAEFRDKGTAVNTDKKGDHTHKIKGWDEETRPKNVAVLYCVKK